jgi:hypothetical protein
MVMLLASTALKEDFNAPERFAPLLKQVRVQFGDAFKDAMLFEHTHLEMPTVAGRLYYHDEDGSISVQVEGLPLLTDLVHALRTLYDGAGSIDDIERMITGLPNESNARAYIWQRMRQFVLEFHDDFVLLAYWVRAKATDDELRRAGIVRGKS